MSVVSHLINGELVESQRTLDVTNPSTGKVIRHVADASAADVERAIAAAQAAFPAWRDTPPAKRAQVMYRFKQLLEEHADRLVQLVSEEHGKTVEDAMGELKRGIENVEYACGVPELLKGEYSHNVGPGIDAWSNFQPLGVVAGITPFNFPAMVPLWMYPMAIACGNTFILKPSEKDPSAAMAVAELLQEAGLPKGVMNVVHGGREAVETLLDAKAVKAISFVGSTPVAEAIYSRGSGAGKRVQALGGAKNHAVILPDADLENAANTLMGAAYGSCGERCMAISVAVCVGDETADRLVETMLPKIAQLKVGPGTDKGLDMGPLVTKAHRDKVASYVDAGEADGATIVVDGRTVQADGAADGFWLGPTLIDHVKTDMSIYTDEIFGPVLSVVRVDTYDEALELINSNPYGNGTAIFTNDGGAARRFQNEVEVGMIGINVPIPVPMAYYSFGGWKNSLFGDSHAHGTEGIHFFTRGKAVTSRWLDPSHGGINLGFPQNT